jgi:hypothetical protein
MSSVVGGLRARLIRDSIYQCIYDALDELGWFDAGRRHRPIIFTGASVANDEEIAWNTIALSDEDLTESDLEMGSTAVETRWAYYVDFYAEDDSIGKHLIHDVRDLLAGRMSSIGRAHARVEIYDYRMATPAPIFSVDLEHIEVSRAHDFPKAWQKHWYACRFDVIDAYDDDAV